ncbi:mitochondrial carrier [Gonapodya prolifera JEL478]|uniref:Mitochondrial carrier n=1 Tax=Gonapodya prolifera (strain JEL478) TaxID=1344416 RepID=A0A139AVM5_GONPJ|nr:mitochondrial carrier [Gonapodya prolifera JEL478]|eukprot:KXS20633.1 mitochondrial carrier [Gonapodya prolifera JEL478]
MEIEKEWMEPCQCPGVHGGIRKLKEMGKGFVHGALAASGAVLVSNPAEVVKTRLQLQGELGSTRAYTSTADAFTKILRQEGPLALQKGLGPALLYQIAMNGTRLGFYEPVKRLVQPYIPSHYWASVTAGFSCGALGAFIASPLFLVKARMQAYNSTASALGPAAAATAAVGSQHDYVRHGVFYALRYVYRTEGVAGLWRGVDAGMARTAAGSAVQLSTYESLKSSLRNLPGGADHPYIVELLSAFSTGFIVAAAMNPLDVVYSRMLNMKVVAGGGGGRGAGGAGGSGGGGGGSSYTPYTSSLDCLVKTVRNEGPKALWKGYGAHVLRLAPQSFLTLILLEWIRRVATT